MLRVILSCWSQGVLATTHIWLELFWDRMAAYILLHNAGKLLRLNADGDVEPLELELPGNCKHMARGVAGQDSCIYSCRPHANKVIRIEW